MLTLNSDGIEFTGSYSSSASIPCYNIDANSNCILTYNSESSLELVIVNSIELINASYYLINYLIVNFYSFITSLKPSP